MWQDESGMSICRPLVLAPRCSHTTDGDGKQDKMMESESPDSNRVGRLQHLRPSEVGCPLPSDVSAKSASAYSLHLQTGTFVFTSLLFAICFLPEITERGLCCREISVLLCNPTRSNGIFRTRFEVAENVRMSCNPGCIFSEPAAFGLGVCFDWLGACLPPPMYSSLLTAFKRMNRASETLLRRWNQISSQKCLAAYFLCLQPLLLRTMPYRKPPC